MVTTLTNLTFKQYLYQYPEGEGKFELVNGEFIKWDDDYIDKLEEYERLGIKEYWIVDYLAIASRQYLGNPKVPTIFVYSFIESKYQVNAFRDQDIIVSTIFPELKLTVTQVLDASGIK